MLFIWFSPNFIIFLVVKFVVFIKPTVKNFRITIHLIIQAFSYCFVYFLVLILTSRFFLLPLEDDKNCIYLLFDKNLPYKMRNFFYFLLNEQKDNFLSYKSLFKNIDKPFSFPLIWSNYYYINFIINLIFVSFHIIL